MGRTVPSFRMVLESEIAQWASFRKALPSEADREAFDELMDICRNYSSESSCACNPIPFEPMILSIALGQQKRINMLEKEINALKQEK